MKQVLKSTSDRLPNKCGCSKVMPNEAVRDYAVSGIEPTLCEALDDPGIRLLMAGDGVTRGDLELLISAIRHTGTASIASPMLAA